MDVAKSPSSGRFLYNDAAVICILSRCELGVSEALVLLTPISRLLSVRSSYIFENLGLMGPHQI